MKCTHMHMHKCVIGQGIKSKKQGLATELTRTPNTLIKSNTQNPYYNPNDSVFKTPVLRGSNHTYFSYVLDQ